MTNKKKLKMPGQPLRVGLVQLQANDNLADNLKQIFKSLNQFKSKKVDLVVLPENALYLRLDKSPANGPTFNLKEAFWAELQMFCDQKKMAILIGSVPYRKAITAAGSGKRAVARPTNATVYLQPRKKPKVVYEKIHLFDVDVKGAPQARESHFFKPGKKPAVLTVVGGWRIGLSICYDIRFAELYSRYTKAGAHALFVPAAFLVPTGRAHWHTLLRARAIEAQCYVLAPAQSGGHKNKQGYQRETFGHSLAVDPWGVLMADLGNQGFKAQVVELRPESLQQVWQQIPQKSHRRL